MAACWMENVSQMPRLEMGSGRGVCGHLLRKVDVLWTCLLRKLRATPQGLCGFWAVNPGRPQLDSDDMGILASGEIHRY